MSLPETETASTALRDSIESSVASHTDSPDVESISNGARELRDQELRKTEKTPIDIRDRLRKNIRDAVIEAKTKAASPAKKKADGFEVPPGPPVSWDQNAKAAWSEMPQQTRLAALREQKNYTDSIKPIVDRYSQIEQSLAPHRERFATRGISDQQAVSTLFEWEKHLSGPNKVGAHLNLMQANGISLNDVVNFLNGQAPPLAHEQSLQTMQQNSAGQQEAAARQEIAQFAHGKPDFQALAPAMGHLMLAEQQQNGREISLQEAYNRVSGKTGMNGSSSASKRRASVSPRGGSPIGKVERDDGKRSGGIRNSIVSAFREARERD